MAEPVANKPAPAPVDPSVEIGAEDKRAVTRQWVSFHHVGTPRAEELSAEAGRLGSLRGAALELRTR